MPAIVLLILVLSLILRLLIAAGLPPGFDEAYYYLYTRHLDWSYFDHPPLVAWVTGFGPLLTGQVSALSIRLGSMLLFTGSSLLLYQSGVHLFSVRAGLISLAVANIAPILLVGFGVLTLPDSPLIFFMSATLWVCSREFFPLPARSMQGQFGLYGATRYQPGPRLALIGLLVGLAGLGKYHGLALGFGLVLFCLLSPHHRRALGSGWTVMAVLGFLLALSPVLFWNAQQDWVSFRFQGGRALPEAGYRLLDLALTVLVGILYLLPSLGIPLWRVSLVDSGRIALQIMQGLRLTDGDLKRLLILACGLPLVLGFTVMGGYRQILPTWPMPGFWVLTLLLGSRWEGWRRVGRGLIASLLIGVLLVGLGLAHVRYGLLQAPGGLGLWPVEKDPSTQLIEIEPLRRAFQTDPDLVQALAEADFVFTNAYFLAGQIAMALAPLTDKPLTCLDEDLRGFAFWSEPQDWLGQNGLLITSELFRPSAGIPATYGDYFVSLEPVAEIPLLRAGAVAQTFQVYLARQMLRPYPRPYSRLR
ncbi:glycosyltransferase family 39 protein [Synechococcus sp. Nb3U1]|uniref:ArnT family glycosyltransferase n=1 Tax=Synechococcus sp. Nb3U1 TaxID=1914529 RepID=UPI001F1CC413|nr:glycosyltransferase family 39 protein [Synechococcus sp. Nb3U1]MCF2969892.1 glycosyltransferase family 39 protein [Synechococcus sp. Nb3U1]